MYMGCSYSRKEETSFEYFGKLKTIFNAKDFILQCDNGTAIFYVSSFFALETHICDGAASGICSVSSSSSSTSSTGVPRPVATSTTTSGDKNKEDSSLEIGVSVSVILLVVIAAVVAVVGLICVVFM